ncbi:MAG TPA: MFS transporter [Solirubrobacteraceae bacterium]|nr:MFS transporter [Solirubrobacteraceae bacterium]
MHGRHRTPNTATAPRAHGRTRWSLLLVLSVAQLMVILDISAVNVALPDLASDLNIPHSDIGWTITSYSLIFGSLLLFGGRAADLLGRRRVFLTGLAVFTASSLVTALAADAAMLFAARAGQGLGAAMLSPAALSIITRTFHGPERAKALGVWGAVGGAGAAIGVLLGGVLTELVDWRAIFFINLPVGVLVAAGAAHLLPADTARPQWRGLDLRGALLATASLGTLVYALSQAQSSGWTSTQTLGLGAAGLTGLAVFAALELRTVQPLLRVQRLADRAVGGGFAMMLAASAVLFGSFLLSSLYLQNVLGTGALETGLAFLPFAVAIGAGVHAAGHVITHAGVRIPLAGGFAIAAAGMLLLSRVSAHGSYAADVLPGMFVAGIGLGIILVSVSVSVLTGAADHESGMLSGLNTTGHEIGGSLGIAILATIAAGAAGPTAAAAIGDAFLVAAIIAGVASAAALVILPSARTFLPKLALAPRVAVH